jgi:hypothetical protein
MVLEGVGLERPLPREAKALDGLELPMRVALSSGFQERFSVRGLKDTVKGVTGPSDSIFRLFVNALSEARVPDTPRICS